MYTDSLCILNTHTFTQKYIYIQTQLDIYKNIYIHNLNISRIRHTNGYYW